MNVLILMITLSPISMRPSMLVGYVVGLFIVPAVLSQEAYLAISALLAVAATMTPAWVPVGCIAAFGFANATMWPTIFPLEIRGLGRHTETGSALLIMAIAGGAILPYAFAVLNRPIDLKLAYLALALPGYQFIGW